MHRLSRLTRLLNVIQVLFGTTLLLVIIVSCACAQTSSTDGMTPLSLTPGSPTGSYPLSGFDNINLFNGSLNFHFPLFHVGGRGEAQYTMMLPIENHWRVIDRSNDYQEIYKPQDGSWNQDKPGYGPGLLLGRAVSTDYGSTDQTACSHYPSTSYWSLTRLTFILPDGTEYEFRDQNTGGAKQV